MVIFDLVVISFNAMDYFYQRFFRLTHRNCIAVILWYVKVNKAYFESMVTIASFNRTITAIEGAIRYDGVWYDVKRMLIR